MTNTREMRVQDGAAGPPGAIHYLGEPPHPRRVAMQVLVSVQDGLRLDANPELEGLMHDVPGPPGLMWRTVTNLPRRIT